MEKDHSQYRIKPLLIQDIGQAIKLSNAERWNQTEENWALLIQNKKNVCLAAFEEKKVVGTATAINYANEVAWVGMVLVDQEYRGKGVSKMILSDLLGRLQFCRSLKLDATPAGQPVYQKFGFKDEYLVHRMTAVSVSMKSLFLINGLLPELIQRGNIPEIVDCDKQLFGANRQQLIEFLVENNPENSWMFRREGQISGIALGRKGSRFYQIGPVFTSETEDAKKLIAKSLENLKGQPVVVDVPEDKKELINWLESIGFTKQRFFVRMYQNENPFPGIPEKHFLICGPEFG